MILFYTSTPSRKCTSKRRNPYRWERTVSYFLHVDHLTKPVTMLTTFNENPYSKIGARGGDRDRKESSPPTGSLGSRRYLRRQARCHASVSREDRKSGSSGGLCPGCGQVFRG